MHTWLSVVLWYYSAYFAAVLMACLTHWAERGTAPAPAKQQTLGGSFKGPLLRYYPWQVDSFFRPRRPAPA